MEYSINLVLSFIYGIIFKIYDDIIDNKLNINEYYVDILKYIVITLFSIIFFNDGVFSTLWFVMAFSSLIMDKFYTSKLQKSKDTIEQKDFTCFNDNLWMYSLFLSGFFIIYHIFKNFNSFKHLNLFSWKNINFLIYITLQNMLAIKNYILVFLF